MHTDPYKPFRGGLARPIDHAVVGLPFAPPPCPRCQGLGLWIEPSGAVATCPEIAVGNSHVDPSPAAAVLKRSIDLLKYRGIKIDALLFDIAKTLATFRSNDPCSRDLLISTHFSWTKSPLRNLHYRIEELRSVWLLPVGSRKADPSGYWIITELDDFAEWVERSKSAPIQQLSTIHRVAKANFPVFAEQMELEFWNDIEPAGEGVTG